MLVIMHQNIIRADVDEANKVTIAFTKNIFEGTEGGNDGVAAEWGKLLGQLLKALAISMGESGMNPEIAELKIMNALNASIYSIEEPRVRPGEAIPGDDEPPEQSFM